MRTSGGDSVGWIGPNPIQGRGGRRRAKREGVAVDGAGFGEGVALLGVLLLGEKGLIGVQARLAAAPAGLEGGGGVVGKGLEVGLGRRGYVLWGQACGGRRGRPCVPFIENECAF